jgi:predicted RecA/RadA family phage recombinase
VFQAEVRRPQCVTQKLDLPRREIVETGDLVPIGEQTVNQVTADEAGRAGYQDFQGVPFLPQVLAATV